MNLFSTVLLFSSLPLIHAQYGNNKAQSTTTTAASSTTSTTSAASGVHTVDVGEDGLAFNPSSLTVAMGDKVEFHFFPPDHSVVQGSFANPCQPSSGGFFSGFFPTTAESKTVFTVTVNNTDPIWFYCGVQGHCQAGMVGVINPPSSGQDTLDAFKSAAAKTTNSNVPAHVAGGVFGTESSENSNNTTSGSATGTSSGSASKTSASTATTTNAANTMRVAGDVGALMLLGLFSWLMM